MVAGEVAVGVRKGRRGNRYFTRDQATERGRRRPMSKAFTVFTWMQYNLHAPSLAAAGQTSRGPPRSLKRGWTRLYRDGRPTCTATASPTTPSARAPMPPCRSGPGQGADASLKSCCHYAELSCAHRPPLCRLSDQTTQRFPWPPSLSPLQLLHETMCTIDLSWPLQQRAAQLEMRAADERLPPQERAAAAAAAGVARNSWVELRCFPRSRFDMALCTCLSS